MKRCRYILLLLVLIFSIDASAQRRKDNPRKKHKQQTELQDNRKDKVDGEMEARRNRHKKVQTKQTRKRMKKSAKKAKRARSNKSVPWYRRWFSK